MTVTLTKPVVGGNDGTWGPILNTALDVLTAGVNASAPTLVPTAIKTSAYTAAVSDLVKVDTTSGSVAITLPTAPADLSTIEVKQITRGGTNVVTVLCGGSDVFNKVGGATTLTITLSEHSVTMQYQATGAFWIIIGVDLPLSQLDARYFVETINVVATSGVAQTIPDPATGTTISRIILTGTPCVLTFPTAATGKSLTIVLVQDATGTRLVTWPATVKWAGGTAPTLSTGVNKVDQLRFLCTDGTTWAGQSQGLDIR